MAPRRAVPALVDVVGRLQPEQLCLLASVDTAGRPEVSAVSWLRGRPPDEMDLMVGAKARLVRNLRHNAAVTLAVFQESVYTLSGTAQVVEVPVEGLPIPLALVRVRFDGVYDGLFTGGRLTGPPTFVKQYPPKLSHLDRLVAERLAREEEEAARGGALRARS
jgi:hypothetical protein